MYYLLKWIVCGIIAFFNPLIAVILFVGWMTMDLMVGKSIAEEKIKREKLSDASIVDLEQGDASYGSYRSYIDFRKMIWCAGFIEPDGDTHYLIRRDGQGNWFSKLTPESQKKALFHFEKIKNLPLYDKKEHEDAIANDWENIHPDYADKIESAYQIFLRCI